MLLQLPQRCRVKVLNQLHSHPQPQLMTRCSKPSQHRQAFSRTPTAALLVQARTVQKRQQVPVPKLLWMPPLALAIHRGQNHHKGPHQRVSRHQRGARRQLPVPWHHSPTQTQLPCSARWQAAHPATARGPLRLQMISQLCEQQQATAHGLRRQQLLPQSGEAEPNTLRSQSRQAKRRSAKRQPLKEGPQRPRETGGLPMRCRRQRSSAPCLPRRRARQSRQKRRTAPLRHPVSETLLAAANPSRQRPQRLRKHLLHPGGPAHPQRRACPVTAAE
mmetsp:Transcript_4893/g.14065  ORF Transcript_4893/g.14065 Transcript_4893/m.14065 type:complete len:275 (-) Transcript_4893:1890-2714(-)